MSAIRNKDGIWINTEYFKEEAKKFVKTGRYCDYPKGSYGYLQYWQEQLTRCIKGYEVAGARIPGNMYHYLNFCQIKLVNENSKKKVATKVVTFPDFWDGDYEYYVALEKAKKEGKHFIVLKRRRAGFSFKNAALAANMYNTVRNSYTLLAAYDKKYLYPNGIFTMALSYLNFLNDHTAFGKKRQVVDKQDHIKASYKVFKADGTSVEQGYKSQIQAISFKDNADAGRGKDANLIIFEEAGTFNNLKETYWAMKPSVEQGDIVTGQMILFGCVCAGTKVFDSKGKLINIENLNKDNGIIGYDGDTTVEQRINWFKPVVTKPCYRISFTGGAYIECSDDHPLMIVDKDKHNYSKGTPYRNVTYQEAQLLKPNDQLVTPNSIPIFGDKDVPCARELGLMIGGGNYTKGSVPTLSCSEIEIYNYITNKYDTVGHKNYKQKINNNKYVQLTIQGIKDKLIKYGLYGQVKTNKGLPDNIHSFNKESLCNLLAGYFDADGNVYYNKKKGTVRIVLTSVVYELLESVKYQLLKLGIHSGIAKGYRYNTPKRSEGQTCYIYRLYINKQEDIQCFKDNIHLLVDRKRSTLDKVKKGNRSVFDAKFYVNPLNNKEGFFNSDILHGLRHERVTKVEYIGPQEVYNLNCSANHNYISNGLITRQTGGDIIGGMDFEDMFYNPNSYGLYAFENIYDEEKQGTNCGFFFSEIQNRGGYIDSVGNSLKEQALEAELKIRKTIIESSRDASNIDNHVVEHPIRPREAFLKTSTNIFPVVEIDKWLSKVKTDRTLSCMGMHGYLAQTESGIQFKISDKVRPLLNYYIDKRMNKAGCITVYQEPYKDSEGVPSGLYLIVHDPYAHDEASASVSIGAAYVIKLINNFSKPDDLIVASYVGRPDTQDEYNRNLFMLAEFYNAKIAFENDMGDVYGYAKRFKKLQYLMPELEIINPKDNVIIRKLGRKYGMSINAKGRRAQGALYLRDWINTKRGQMEDGNHSTNLNYIYDTALLEELKNYSAEGNFDRISALIVGMYYMSDIMSKKVYNNKKEYEDRRDSFFNRPIFV